MNERDEIKKKPEQLPAEVGRLIDQRKLISPGAAVVVGVSGGADSVALLAVLRALAADKRRAYRLSVAHLDHGLRDESDADARFVAELARSWDLPCIIGSPADWPADESLRRRDGIEGEARRRRYAFLLDAARQAGAGFIAVGHHADDNVETILERIVRGSHLRGLRGMAAARPIGDGGVMFMLVRPLLSTRRSEIEAYCHRQSLTWRTDHTNADTAFRRNFIRHELLPLLRDRMNPAVDDALQRLASAAGDVEDYLAAAGEDALARALTERQPSGLVLSCEALAGEKPLIRGYALRSALETMGAPMRDITAERIEQLCSLVEEGGASAVSLPGGIVARRERDEILIEALPDEKPADDQAVTLACPGETTIDEGEIVCTIEAFDEQAYQAHCANRPAGVELLDADKVSGPLICRPRRDGDSFTPLGSPGTQSVSDLLTNLKLPARARRQVHCICDSSGIIYLAPCRIADRVKITPNTTSILKIELRTR